MKKSLVLCVLLLTSALLNSQENVVQREGGTNSKTNFILIVADDLGYGDLSFTGSKQIKTPNIDELAETGVFFSNAYVSAPVCSPSRAGFLTGINQVSFGYDNNLGGNQPGFDPEYRGLPVEQKTIANHLKEYGYVTGLIGKWHLGYEEQFYPTNRGFDEFWGYRGGSHDYFSGVDKNGNATIECNYKTPQKITYITDDKGDECVDFIRRHKNESFFLYASFNAPHTPMQALKEDLEVYKHIQNEKRRTYAAMVHRLDLNVGKIVKSIEEEKLAENTVIVFISDNGGPVKTNGSINAPYNGKKGTLLEGGIHIPFIVNWKGRLPEGRKIEQSISSLDIAPTFINIAKGDKKRLESDSSFTGESLMPILEGGEDEALHKTLMWKFTISAAIKEDNWKLIRIPDRLPMLFNLTEDVSEEHNVVLENLDIAERMLKKLGNWEVRLPHPLFLENAMWKKIQLDQYDTDYPILQPDN
ncbi:sulfatase-like hydrolase/transferase [Joostella atrarenae]|uniref:Sulfatase-like hydrolase/transferase n=1 Tax=Joostella atrarenae TaxID=679257 RepID=A0ABS9J5A8_9FLAO|nr:sulfatase-like hydrolase/transferase [Joostella atrarenae]MCF8715623.1 sulfatase-like hydrolase/transferase [Joostella atrarenae]